MKPTRRSPAIARKNLGGIMFDSIGANHRQGTAIFVDSFISKPRANDPNPAAWTQRMIFWCAYHEMGHAFNLAHSWQKGYGGGWIELEHEPEARSFMNYPYNVSGGERAFFDDFDYRFSDGELFFMRHAPAQFVQMGNADWFDDHAFEYVAISLEPSFDLGLRDIDYKWYVDTFSEWLAKKGEPTQSFKVQDLLLNTLSARAVRGRKILNRVLDATKAKRDSYR